MTDLPSTDELRATIRAVLRELLPDGVAPPTTGPTPASVRDVRLGSEADLTAFVAEVAELAEDPARRAELRAGRHRFRLAPTEGARPDTGAPAGGVRVESGAPAGVVRVESGAVTERTVLRAAAAGAGLVVGKRAVLTPLARDRARALGLDVAKES
jgi:hypothetical protein